MQIQTVALIGAGAIGAYFIPGLAHTLGEDFCVIAEGTRKERLEQEGMCINGVQTIFSVKTPEEAGQPDLVLIATKYGALEEIRETVRSLTGPHTTVISTLNGIDSEEILAGTIGWEPIVYGFMRVSAVRTGNVVTYGNNNRGLYFGETDGRLSPRILAIRDLLTKAEIPYVVSEDIIKDQWFKYACNIAENQCQAVLGVPFGSFRDHPHVNFVRLHLMQECLNVAEAKGIHIPDSELVRQEETLKTVPYLNKTSMLQDIEQGRTTEVEMLSGTLIRIAKEVQVPVPYNELIYHAIRAIEDRNAGAFDTDPDVVIGA
ncbi:MAG: 2-dehydropantoate 2-reductase [Lachnospiraceae bacterium]|nr:2-dehydropantoate 2-reductase [Lachnospiraceae bacterium]